MKFLLGLVGLLAAVSLARAQISVSAETTRTNFLLYERVDILVTIANQTDSPIVLDNTEGQPWLSFIVAKHDRLPVRPERQSEFAPLNLKPSETKTLRVNITPLFSFREEGDFTVAAVVNLPGAGPTMSQPIPFTVMRGKVIWSQLRPLDGAQRTYSLVRFSPDANTTRLYLRVEDLNANVVFANLALGDLASYCDPDVQFDPNGNLHILQPVAMSLYLYTRADPDGKILNQTMFRTYHEIRPLLHKLDDGNVVVVGGQAINEKDKRELLSNGQHGDAATPRLVPAPAPGQ